jgi:oligopeptidase A
VLFYEVYDEESNEHLGSFYADWYPRDSKRGGAWMNCLACGCPPMNGQPRVPHLALMCGNISRPVGDKPALLTHGEVETVFHEFGHLLHQILSGVEVESLAGCNVAWDFVELPSQINENWCWESEALDRFARHWQTGEPLPAELKRKMLAARNCGAATFAMRQLCFGKLDLELHTNTATYAGRDVEEVDREILADYRIPTTEQSNSVLRCFTHIFDGGYESGYYSYKWAEMLEADAFSRFAAEGIFTPATGRDFRRCILSQGNSRPAAELYRDFMQRDPDPEAMLRRSGIC